LISLEKIDRVVPFESFRAEIEAAVLTPVSDRKSTAGRKPIDVIARQRSRRCGGWQLLEVGTL
jgi:hypothetical protein